jgi:hypothetical protein
VILCYYSLTLIQPFIDQLLQATLLKIGAKILAFSIARLPEKFKKKKKETKGQKETPDFIRDGLPIIVEKFQKNGIDGLKNLINNGLMNLVKNTEIKIVQTENVKKNDISKKMETSKKVESPEPGESERSEESEESQILAEHRKNKGKTE